ncbi:hypothetical protein E2C01_018692 [Portunus trituberculatus]|uniref:Uncharacterized protein n=1 Tax=Portunus trituberculatus TaxID=210409 RepID=A0A5B7DWC3_PORTR|nr:hypothetical protein [Portunus trituberculatus]
MSPSVAKKTRKSLTHEESHDLADKHSSVEATMGDTHQHIARGEYMRFMNRKQSYTIQGEHSTISCLAANTHHPLGTS